MNFLTPETGNKILTFCFLLFCIGYLFINGFINPLRDRKLPGRKTLIVFSWIYIFIILLLIIGKGELWFTNKLGKIERHILSFWLYWLGIVTFAHYLLFWGIPSTPMKKWKKQKEREEKEERNKQQAFFNFYKKTNKIRIPTFIIICLFSLIAPLKSTFLLSEAYLYWTYENVVGKHFCEKLPGGGVSVTIAFVLFFVMFFYNIFKLRQIKSKYLRNKTE